MTPDAVTEKFSAELGRSVVRVPLTERREALESLPWVEQAHVQRVMPNRIRVEINERTPIAFLRSGSDLSLVDVHGVILERPADGEFRFPVVSGLSESMALGTREQRMNLYAQFMKDIEQIQPGANDHVSEVDLSDAADLRATLTGLGLVSRTRRRFWCTLAMRISAAGIICLRKISISGGPAREASIRWTCGLRGKWW